MLIKAFAAGLSRVLIIPATLLIISISTKAGVAQGRMYSPIPLPPGNEINDTLTDKDIPIGEGGFARDYLVRLTEGDNVAIEATSDSFDTIVILLGPNGSTVVENDDGPGGSTNSLLFTRITKTGNYVIRVRSFGETGVGAFKLKVTRLRPV